MEDVLDCIAAPFFALIDFTLDTPAVALAIGALVASAAFLATAW
jgi:hypothetical protein